MGSPSHGGQCTQPASRDNYLLGKQLTTGLVLWVANTPAMGLSEEFGLATPGLPGDALGATRLSERVRAGQLLDHRIKLPGMARQHAISSDE